MAEDPWAAFRVQAAPPADPWTAFRAAPPPAPEAEPRQIKVQAAPAPAASEDPIRKQVFAEERAWREKKAKAGLSPQDPYQRTLVQGLTMGTADEVLAALNIPVEMYKRGTWNPAEAYNYAKARQDFELEDARARGGIPGAIAEAAGGVGSGVGLYRMGATVAPAIASRLGSGFLGTTAGSIADGALYGAASGLAEGNGAERFDNALQGGALGAGLGAAVPTAIAGAGLVASPLLSNVSARMNPGRYADRQLYRAATESGQTPQQVADRVAQAAADGQAEYRLVDALDNAGRRVAATVAKNPGEGRQQLVEFFDQRQAGQGGRVAQAIEEGLGAAETAQAASARLAAARRAQDDIAFPALRNSADPVDVAPVLATIDSVLEPGVSRAATPSGPLAPDSIEAVLGRARNMLASDNLTRTSFGEVQRVRGEVADAVEKAQRAGEGNKARLLRDVRNAMDRQLEAASQGFRDAMAASAQAARTVDAVDAGSLAARRGRTENKLAAYNVLTPEQQAAFRTGYADPLIARAQGMAMNADAARPLTSLAARTELPAFAAPGQGEPMMRRLGRESDMFRTRATATGGSATAENLADSTVTGLDPSILGRLLAGDFSGVVRNALQRGGAVISGNTGTVRERLAERLLNGSPDEIRALLQQLADEAAQRSTAGATALRGLIGGAEAIRGQ